MTPTDLTGEAVEAAARNVYAYMRGVITASGVTDPDITDRVLPETWEELSPSWRARYRGIATVAIEGWQLHHTLYRDQQQPGVSP